MNPGAPTALVEAGPGPTAQAKLSKTNRIPALDFTKGALVLIMVLYHWANYFLDLSWTFYRYLHFLTPSFIFITGFMVSHVYLSKYAANDPRLPKRLVTRGLKLMAIFLFLNVARTLIIPVLGTGTLGRNPVDSANLFTIFVSGNLPATGAKLVAFSILVPISYMLMLSGVLMLPYRFYRYTFELACGLLLLAIFLMSLTGAQSTNLEFITIGMLGVLAGFLPIAVINNFMRRPYTLAFAYVAYAIAITIWNVPFPLLILGVSLNLMVIYLAASRSSESDPISGEIILLGKYSLFGYLSQIAILQILSAASHHFDRGVTVLGISFVAAFVLTIVSVEVLDRARERAAMVDRLYKAVFA
jgi:peptidoglycan/LPS O-acetylase OafA/YrhL